MAKFGPNRDAQGYQLQLPNDTVSFDPEAFDNFIRSQGVVFVHFRGMRCPVGLVDADDIRRPHEHHEGCSNSFLYTKAGEVTCGFMGNSSDPRFIDAGRLNGSTVTVVVPRFYDDQPEEEVELTYFDRLYLKEEAITVTNWLTYAAHMSGVDRLQFPVITVQDLVDSNGIRYRQDTDFTVKNGQIHWGAKRPGVDPKTGKGVVCSIRYKYRPFWYVKDLIHEVRVGQVEDEYTGDRGIMRFPKAAVIQRELFFEKEQNDSQVKESDRQKPGPSDGGFGSR